jgi:glycosyltransferase involved in cell wall biosynthesis
MAALRVLVVAACPFPYPRGTPVRVQREAEALADRGHQVEVATYHLGGAEPVRGVPVHRIRPSIRYGKVTPGPSPAKIAILDPQLMALVRRLHAAAPFDVIHAHHYEGLGVALAARLPGRPPIVYDAHTMLASELPTFLPRPLQGLVRRAGLLVDRALPPRADHVVTVTETIRARRVDELGLPATRATFVPNGVELEHFATVAPGEPIRNGRPAVVMFTGNLAAYQRIDLLLRAFARLLRSRADTRLVVVTDGSFAPYEGLAADLGVRGALDLVPAPPFAELPALLATADVCANPRTDCDGMPVKLLNYLAAARPVVSFAGSAPGIAPGDAAAVVPDADVDAFADALRSLIDEPEKARELGTRGRAHVAQRYRWPAAAETLEGIYRHLLEARA